MTIEIGEMLASKIESGLLAAIIVMVIWAVGYVWAARERDE